MGFDDMLLYEEACVKEAMALPVLSIDITTVDTFSDCETCGSYSSIVHEVSGDLGTYEDGDYASCLGDNRDGEVANVANWIASKLKERNRPFPNLLTPEAMLKAEQEMYDYGDKVDHDYNDPNYKKLSDKYWELANAYDKYYSTENIVKLFLDFGVEINWDFEEEERYDASSWDDDYEEDIECEE